MANKFYNALIQIKLIPIANIFTGESSSRESLLRNVFESELLIPVGGIDDSFAWGIGDTRYITPDDNWLFGYLYKISYSSDVATLPHSAHSLSEIKNLPDGIVNKTAFFFNFSSQRIYTQNQYRICRASRSISVIWEKMLRFRLKGQIVDIDVQSIPLQEDFYMELEQLDIIYRAQFDLFGPNFINEERIKSIISEFDETNTNGLGIILKNYLDGLLKDSTDLLELIRYALKGGGRGVIRGRDKKTGKTRNIETDSKTQVILVSKNLNKEPEEEDIKSTLKEIIQKENNQ